MYNPLSLPICPYLYLYLYHYHTSRHPSTIHIKPQSPEPISHLLPPHPPQRYISSLSPHSPSPIRSTPHHPSLYQCQIELYKKKGRKVNSKSTRRTKKTQSGYKNITKLLPIPIPLNIETPTKIKGKNLCTCTCTCTCHLKSVKNTAFLITPSIRMKSNVGRRCEISPCGGWLLVLRPPSPSPR